ncbi:uncharacterized Rho GTPase-activating protein At5g61530 isoform X1 [Oryza glaberrima]|uniref:uncharacterized Rho GTPase-activating protein At5g61530 isoform X1 n=1 Tax=Oryza glaberrima TaxID=4538 RepID=UPI00224C62D9|nr:uncharacterized Rho GTPase-activating protein At5g61530 isoform X1 [Oryza glaberrima]
MPLAESPQWRQKATNFFSSSSTFGFKLKQAGQSAGDNIADVAGKVGSVVKSRWAVFQEARQRQPPPGETVQERFISAAATTGVLLRKGISETKEKVAVGKVKVEEAAKKTADKSKTILNNIERWQKGVASTDVFGVPIEATVQREQSGKAVPLVLVRCADYLVISGLSNEYLFKSEGEKKVLQQLVSLYNEDSGAPLPDGVNPIDVAALIKCYLASIPEPLTTFSLYDELRDARVSIADLRNILKKLPNVNYMTLEFVTALLLRVSRKSSLNKMDSRSLAVEFAPLIMWQQGDSGTDLRNHLRFTLKAPPKIVDTTSNTTEWDLLDEDDVDASSQIPLDDASPPDYSSIEVIQSLIEHHNAIFTDANETVWR